MYADTHTHFFLKPTEQTPTESPPGGPQKCPSNISPLRSSGEGRRGSHVASPPSQPVTDWLPRTMGPAASQPARGMGKGPLRRQQTPMELIWPTRPRHHSCRVPATPRPHVLASEAFLLQPLPTFSAASPPLPCGFTADTRPPGFQRPFPLSGLGHQLCLPTTPGILEDLSPPPPGSLPQPPGQT